MAFTETAGSRKETLRTRDKVAVVLGVAETSDNDIPDIGDDYPADSGVTNSLLRRKCVESDRNPDVIPGIYVVSAYYRGVQPRT